ncbi:MAG TPA: hypothetical protein VK727_05880 [Steroidobacteraceae bacterium]|nr:hypothetical protein [Steroidobacteraceae bacterium]
MVSAVSGSTAALQGQIQRDQLDLNDWVTCVSAKTPKGQAEIQKFSGEISAAQERLARIEASKSGTPNTASASAPAHSGALDGRDHGGYVDVWA